jgi:hypothetical protein
MIYGQVNTKKPAYTIPLRGQRQRSADNIPAALNNRLSNQPLPDNAYILTAKLSLSATVGFQLEGRP